MTTTNEKVEINSQQKKAIKKVEINEKNLDVEIEAKEAKVEKNWDAEIEFNLDEVPFCIGLL